MKAIDYLLRSKLYHKLIHGPYGEFSRVYASRLSEEGFTRQYTWRSLSLFRDLMDWHVGGGRHPTHLDEAGIERFLDHRSQHWRINAGDRAALRRLLSALRDNGLIAAAPPVTPTEQQQIVEDFSAYIINDRGLTQGSSKRHALLARRFLQEMYPAGPCEFATLNPELIIRYVECHALDGAADSGKAMCCGLRAFLRYLHLRGHIADPLAECVPSIRRWRLARLPTFLPPQKVQEVLDSCDRTTPIGLRDFAILMILANAHQFRKVVRRIADQAGIPAGLTFMDLRRSGLTELGEAGATDDEIRSVSGHKTREIVAAYVLPTDVQAGHALNKRRHARKADGGRKHSSRSTLS